MIWPTPPPGLLGLIETTSYTGALTPVSFSAAVFACAYSGTPAKIRQVEIRTNVLRKANLLSSNHRTPVLRHLETV
jgi:hypothetical protein